MSSGEIGPEDSIDALQAGASLELVTVKQRNFVRTARPLSNHGRDHPLDYCSHCLVPQHLVFLMVGLSR